MKSNRPSFWNLNGEAEEEVISADSNKKSDLIMQSKVYRQKELEDEIKAILLAIESSDYQKAILLDRYIELRNLWQTEFDFEKFPEVLEPIPDMFEANIIDFQNTSFVELRMDLILPYYSKNVTNRVTYYSALKKSYQQPIVEKLRSLQTVIDFKDEKCFVLISQYFTNMIIRDLDNRFHSLIFNGLRSSNLISDDDWNKLSYMENGYYTTSDKPFTNILIGYEKDLIKMIDYNSKISN